jgi:hypothetical protein
MTMQRCWSCHPFHDEGAPHSVFAWAGAWHNRYHIVFNQQLLYDHHSHACVCTYHLLTVSRIKTSWLLSCSAIFGLCGSRTKRTFI